MDNERKIDAMTATLKGLSVPKNLNSEEVNSFFINHLIKEGYTSEDAYAFLKLFEGYEAILPHLRR